MRFLGLFLAVLLLVTAADAAMKPCTLSGTGTITCPTGAADTPCTGTEVSCSEGGTADNDDDLTITGTVSCGGEILQLAAGSIVLGGTGTFSCSPSAAFTPDAPTISLGDAGFTSGAVTTFNVSGRYRQFDSAGTPTLQTSKSTLYFGDIIPCWDNAANEIDCATHGDTVRIEWPVLVYDSASGDLAAHGDTFLGEEIAALEVGEFAIVYDPVESTPEAPSEDNQPWEITAKAVDQADANCADIRGLNGTCHYVELNIRQTKDGAEEETDVFPLADRLVKQGTVCAVSDPQSRYLFATNTLISAGDEYDMTGRWLRIGKPGTVGCTGDPDTSIACPTSEIYMVSRILDNQTSYAGRDLTGCAGGSADVVQVVGTPDNGTAIASALVADVSGSGTFWIDYGFRAGDSAYVMVPVIFTQTTNDECIDAPLLLQGTANLSAVLVDDMGRFSVKGPSATLGTCSDIYSRDNQENVGAFEVGNAAIGRGVVCDRLHQTGGTDRTGCADAADGDTNHGIGMMGADAEGPQAGGTIALSNVSCRYAGDDCTSLQDPGISDVEYSITRVRVDLEQVKTSGGVYDDNPGAATLGNTVTIHGVLCAHCMDFDTDATCAGGSQAGDTNDVFNIPNTALATDSSHSLDGVVIIGSRNERLFGTNGSEATIRNLIVVNGHAIGGNLSNFVYRDYDDANESTMCHTSIWENYDRDGSPVYGSAYSLTRGFFRDMHFEGLSGSGIANMPSNTLTSPSMSDVILYDVISTAHATVNAPQALFPIADSNNLDADDVVIDGVTLAWTPGTDIGWESALKLLQDPDRLTTRHFLIAHAAGSTDANYEPVEFVSAGFADTFFANGGSFCIFGSGKVANKDFSESDSTYIFNHAGTTLIRDVAPGFDDAWSGGVLAKGGAAQGQQCGADGLVGVPTLTWPMAISGLQPELMSNAAVRRVVAY